jgi:hypothetical protein
MKNRKIKKLFLIKVFLIFIISFPIVYWADYIFEYIKTKEATNVWSSNSKITFSKGTTTYYINRDNNIDIIWDYFKGYYYDSVLWFFRLDWSNDKTKNVRIVSAISNCNWSSWYKLDWYAYSKYYWYIDFAYNDNSSIFVCYSTWDNKLHWYAYSKHLWFQNFDGIWFKLAKDEEEIKDKNKFANDTNEVKDDNVWDVENNWVEDTGWGDKNAIKNKELKDTEYESIFWIIN